MLRKMKNMFGDKQITTADLYQEMADYNSRLQECLKQKEELEKQEKYAIYENDPDNLAKIDNQIKTLKGQIKALGKMIKAKRRLFPIVERDEHHSTLNTELCAVLKAVEIAANDFRKKWQELEESMVYLVALEQLADNQIERLRSYAEKIGAQRPNISPVMKRLANNGERWASFSDRLRLPSISYDSVFAVNDIPKDWADKYKAAQEKARELFKRNGALMSASLPEPSAEVLKLNQIINRAKRNWEREAPDTHSFESYEDYLEHMLENVENEAPET